MMMSVGCLVGCRTHSFLTPVHVCLLLSLRQQLMAVLALLLVRTRSMLLDVFFFISVCHSYFHIM